MRWKTKQNVNHATRSFRTHIYVYLFCWSWYYRMTRFCFCERASTVQQGEMSVYRGWIIVLFTFLVKWIFFISYFESSLFILIFFSIYFLDFMGALRLDNLNNCTIYAGTRNILRKSCTRIKEYRTNLIFNMYAAGPVGGSTFFEKLTSCTLIIASRQIRIHESTKCDFYIQVSSNPIIEDCSSIRYRNS